MEQLSLASDQEERQLKRVGRTVAAALEPSDGRAIAAARRKLFEPKEERSTGGRWVLAFAGAGAAAAIFFALRGDPAPSSGTAARGGDKATPANSADSAKEGVRAADSAKSRLTQGPGGASELVLESGEARGKLGDGAEVATVAAGPYRITGNARVVVTWADDAGLELEVSEGEARVLAPGMTAVIVTAGSKKTLPAKP
jgi:hypothetical protein